MLINKMWFLNYHLVFDTSQTWKISNSWKFGQKFDFSILEYNDYIDGQLTDLTMNMPYEVLGCNYRVKKYDIDTDEIVEVALKMQAGTFRIVAPAAFIEHLEIIEDKIYDNTRLFIVRTELDLLHVFVK